MSRTAVVCDSSASIPEEMIRELDIHVVPIYIHHEDKVWRDMVDLSQDEFYRWLPTVEKLPTTAYPGPADFLTVYQGLAETGADQIISLQISSKSSGTFEAARTSAGLAAQACPGLVVHPVDTLNVAMCHGWMVIEAARAAKRGEAVEDIIAMVDRLKPVTEMIQTADTLRYLHMGGRIGGAAHLLGSMLNIKPLIGMREGMIVPLGRERSSSKAYAAMVDMVEQQVGSGGRVKVAYVHTAAPERVEILKSMLESRVSCVETIVAELSPALGVHSGPGAAGICFFPADALKTQT